MSIFAPLSEIVGDQICMLVTFILCQYMGQFTMSLYPRTLLNVLPVDCNVIVAIRTGLFMIKSQGMT